MRPQPPSGTRSATPIYDALYAEYRRSFRALPGDRSGEEELGFSSFTAGLHSMRHPLPPQLYGTDNGRPSGLGVPLHAALPPAPRREP
jgi:hypothetical protein